VPHGQATDYHNISTILDEIDAENYGQIGNWTDENNTPLFCKLESGVVRTLGYVFIVRNGRCLLTPISEVIVHFVDGRIFTQIKKRSFDKKKSQHFLLHLSVPHTVLSVSVICRRCSVS